MPGDLHTHSTFSDGAIHIDKLAPMAAWAGMTHLAVTDHDTFLAYDHAVEHPQQCGVQLIPATELSAWDFERGRKVHLLCYGPDKTPELQKHMEEIGAGRNRQQEKSISLLLEKYPFLTRDEIAAKAQDSGVLYKAHIMRTLRDYALTDKIFGQTYQQLLGKQGSCRASKNYKASVQDLLAAAHRARAVVILAHPGVYDSMELAYELAAQGLIDGVEIQHPGNSPAQQIELRNLAMEYNLIVTGGTDYHGMNNDKVCPIGSCNTNDAQLERLLALMRERHR